jgi:hypothetical protein
MAVSTSKYGAAAARCGKNTGRLSGGFPGRRAWNRCSERMCAPDCER